MRGKENHHCGSYAHGEMGGVRNPENRVSIQQQVAQCAAAQGREAGDKGEAYKVKLSAAGDQRPRNRKDQNGGIFQQGDQAHLVLNGAMPARANSSARSFSGWPAWPLTHSQVT